MVIVEELLVEILEQLGREDFDSFKYNLQWLGNYGGLKPIPKCKLEMANVRETVSVMVQKYDHQVVEVVKTVLGKIDMHDLVRQLSDRSSELNDSELPTPELTEQQILVLQHKLQSHLSSNFMCVQEGMAERTEEQRLDNIFVELFIIDSGEIQINEQHEVVQNEIQKRPPGTEKPIKLSEIFKSPAGIPLRTVLTTGFAGIGKTFLVKKFVLDWAEKRENQDVHLIFPFSFSELNEQKGQTFCLAKLIHTTIWESRAITEEDLKVIFQRLQASGSRDYDKSQYKLLFVLDGLDESHLQLDLSGGEQQPPDFDVTKSTSVEVLLTALIRGNLLPAARVWITTRPGAASQHLRNLAKRITVVRGFNDPQKEEYFKKKFTDEEQASTVIKYIKASQSLFIMCHIPVFCWITSAVIQDILKKRTKKDLPTTLTEMYTEFLMYQFTHTSDRCGTKKSTEYIQALAKLAFQKLQDGNQFYEQDLKHISLNFHAAALDFGLFTEVFKEVRRWKQDGSKGKKYSFVHLSLQEYLAALYVVMSLINDNKNVLSEPHWIRILERLCIPCKKRSMTEVHEIAIQKALECPTGQLDLFLRFLLGLSLQTCQDLLQPLLKMTKGSPHINHQLTIQSIQKRIRDNTSPERSINLFYCLYELKDNYLVEDIRHYLNSQSLSISNISAAQWTAVVFILLTSENTGDGFDLRKYCPSEEGLLHLMPVVKASYKSLLSGCSLSHKICDSVASVLCSPSSKLRELDLSDNELQDSGVKSLCAGLENPDCALETLQLSGCMISEEGCAFLASALKSNPSNLKELDLSYNHPGVSGKRQLSALLRDPHWRLETLNLDYCGEQRLQPGLKKYVCKLNLDKNTAHKNLKLSNNCTMVTTVDEKQPYLHHPERFDCWVQVLCRTGLTGRCYWEVAWKGKVSIAVTYRGIIRKGEGSDIRLGANAHSWMLLCDGDGSYSIQHENTHETLQSRASPVSNRVAVFLDFPAGTLSFYKVTSDTLVPLHTFKSTFTEPLYPAFGFGFAHGFRNFGSSVTVLHDDNNMFFPF